MLNQLIYADIKSGSTGGEGWDDDIPPPPPDLDGYERYDDDGEHGVDDGPVISEDYLHAGSGRPIYSSNCVVVVKWGFSMNGQNLFPKAILNGKEVCGQHSPAHVVSYAIGKTSGSVTIKMSLKSSGKDCKWNGGASCSYTATLSGHSLTKNGTCGGGATFRVVIKSSGEVSIS